MSAAMKSSHSYSRALERGRKIVAVAPMIDWTD
jgi:hypothetical protein